ncbi:MAG: mechanosensitive ion channel domain-containing protein, partial [Pseudomonadota bacterium]
PARRPGVGAALVRVLARVIPGFVAGAIIFQTLRAQGVVDAATAPIARNLWFGFLALLTADAGATAVFSPGTPGWRLVPLHAFCGQVVRFLLLALVLLFFLDRALEASAAVYGGNQELALVQSAVIAIAMAIVLFLFGRRPLWRLAEGRETAFTDETKRFWRNTRRLLGPIALAIIVAALIGYVALAHYAATRVFMLAGLLALGLFVRLIAQEALHALDRSLAGSSKTATEKEESEEERLIFFWIGAFLDLMIILILTPVAFLALGAEWADVRDVVRDAFFGFKIGNVTISVAQIFSAIALFVVILGVTRFIQRTGEKRFFPRTRMDIGVQNSLKTLIGYVGLVIAFISAVSVLGFNLSNLAIIAGALSVGIGFGLQSIVNNFVSGLILLFERPIKVGDWIVTGSGEGIVKNISVRSTEIETFDRSSVIVPNSELISSAVTNWTHKNKIGRLILPIGVSYNCDPDHVIGLLQEVGKESPVLLSYPEPFVYFDSFGDSSLNFELRGYIRDVGSSLSAKTALRVAIFNKLKGAGVEIPFPQRDINIRSGGGVDDIATPRAGRDDSE